MYFDAELEGSSADSGDCSNGEKLFIGNAESRGGAGYNWLGQVDDARIYNRALSQPEVNALHINSLTGEYKEFPRLDVSRFFMPAAPAGYIPKVIMIGG